MGSLLISVTDFLNRVWSGHLYLYRRLQGNQNTSGLQCKALAVCSAAQLAAAHCLNERNLDPQSAAITDPLMPQSAAL